MPWYTTADARRDAEKQAARRKQEITGNDGMSYTFEIGKSGAVKAIHDLGADEIAPHWTWQAVAIRQLIAERDQLRTRLAEIEKAPTVAVIKDEDRPHIYRVADSREDLPPVGTELIARPKVQK